MPIDRRVTPQRANASLSVSTRRARDSEVRRAVEERELDLANRTGANGRSGGEQPAWLLFLTRGRASRLRSEQRHRQVVAELARGVAAVRGIAEAELARVVATPAPDLAGFGENTGVATLRDVREKRRDLRANGRVKTQRLVTAPRHDGEHLARSR
jgi:hypothetical protein